MKVRILGLFPLSGNNGGIASWAKNYLSAFSDNNFVIDTIDIAKYSGVKHLFFLNNLFNSLFTMFIVRRKLQRKLLADKYDIIHATTSGRLGILRDFMVGRICKKKGVKTILHCHYGCIISDYKSKLWGGILRLSFKQYDQIWVLDQFSYDELCKDKRICEKINLVPNFICVGNSRDLRQKEYHNVAFVGNLLPSKGIFELVEAAKHLNVRLDIVGPGTNDVLKKIKLIAGADLSKKIFIHGRLTNEDAVKFMQDVDIVALPTFYPFEAFPVSILEAMSLSKLVISCPRAAIPEMLTACDGTMCGILVKEQSYQAIVEAIMWCQSYKLKADLMCQKAFDKVYFCYRTDIVLNKYKANYNRLLEK